MNKNWEVASKKTGGGPGTLPVFFQDNVRPIPPSFFSRQRLRLGAAAEPCPDDGRTKRNWPGDVLKKNWPGDVLEKNWPSDVLERNWMGLVTSLAEKLAGSQGIGWRTPDVLKKNWEVASSKTGGSPRRPWAGGQFFFKTSYCTRVGVQKVTGRTRVCPLFLRVETMPKRAPLLSRQ